MMLPGLFYFHMKTIALITAAGSSKRMKGKGSKPFLVLGSKPLIVHTIAAFERADVIDGIFLVLQPEEIGKFEKEIISKNRFSKILGIVAGGKERQESVKNGLDAIEKICKCAVVAIHDGARPLIEPQHISKVVLAAKKYGAATLAVPAKDTIKIVDAHGFCQDTLDRKFTWQTQTPQAFTFELIMEAHKKAKGNLALDDASLVEAVGHRVKIVEGAYSNIKITTPEDLHIAEALIKRRT